MRKYSNMEGLEEKHKINLHLQLNNSQLRRITVEVKGQTPLRSFKKP